MNQPIDVSDFSSFFTALDPHGNAPFSWQERLAQTVCSKTDVADVVDLPTGSGKTAIINVSLFHLAFDLSRNSKRCAPLRIAWVVDRRLIVDDAYDRAKHIAQALDRAENGILKTVADLFRAMAGSGAPPLTVQRLRGGMPREGDWARTPTQPTVLASTVDQVGSRLLFRGYGVSPSMRPIHAGLLGTDTLLILDEVHLAEPFRQTLEMIGRFDHTSNAPGRVMQLSATPRRLSRRVFTLGALTDTKADQELSRRLQSKTTHLRDLGRVEYGSEEHAAQFATAALKAVQNSLEPRKVLVVVNRVNFARKIFDAIREQAINDVQTALLTGRAREVEKNEIRAYIVGLCKSRPAESDEKLGEPLVVVATQSIEAGADLDFDTLITQIAPIDALRQRFGRLNRMGRSTSSSAQIIATTNEVGNSSKADPIYGFAPRETWNWLNEIASNSKGDTIDFGSISMGKALATLDQQRLGSLLAEVKNAPTLMPEYINAWSNTSGYTGWDADPGLFLHGEHASVAERQRNLAR